MPDRVRGAALFADISGFTPLTEALADELGSQRGSEELTRHLGRVFHAVIGELDRFGGDVIYFSGDAITCWLDGDDGLRATAAALAMREQMARVGQIVTPGGVTVQLALKIAVACGDARRFVVGDPDIQLIDVLAGRLIDDLAEAEHHAGKGELILDSSAVVSLGDRVTLGETRADDAAAKTFRIVEALTVDVPETPAMEPEPLPEELVRPWLLPAVYERMRSGRGEFLAELRPAYPVFLRFGGIDYDDDEAAVTKLDDFVRKAQRVMAGHGGNVLQLTLGDKGAYLYGVFGSPVAHEDDAIRAAAAALELRDLEGSTDATGIQVGIAHGRLRSGTYGHAMRRTFVCLGDAVNLAARLMSAAPEGQIYIADEVRDAAGDGFIWKRLPGLKLKGKSSVIVAHQLTGSLERASRRRRRFQLPLIGRKAELDVLNDALRSATGRDGRIVGIAAEAGMGKSRLVAEFVRSARRRGVVVAFGECQSFGSTASYSVWREIWRRLFGIEDSDTAARLRQRVEAELGRIDSGLVARAPLLAAVLGSDIPDNELTGSFDAKLRKASLEDLLVRFLSARVEREPIVLVLEDCHWIDELSRDLLEVIARAAAGLPLLIVLAYRPSSEPGGGVGLERLPTFSEVELAVLDDLEAAALIRSKLDQVSGSTGGVADALVRLVLERSGRNPFYIEELVSFIASRGIDPADEASLRSLELPGSLHSLVLSRIDTVAEAPRRTLKVASVVGRLFRAPILPGAYPELGPLDGVIDHLEILRTIDLVALDREADQAYLFKHVVTQEVAYESLPFGVRSVLHERIGTFIEVSEPEAIDRNLDLLAHHYWHSGADDKKAEFLERAAAAAQASYANAAAIVYYERLLSLLAGPARVDPVLKLADVLQLTGQVARAEELALAVRSLAAADGDTRRVARCDRSIAESERRQGRFDDAAARLQAARDGFESVGDQAGLAEALQVTGTVHAQRGHPAEARAAYEASLDIRRRIGDAAGVAAITNNLGIVAQHEGDLDRARGLGFESLALYRELGDRRRISACEINLGWMEGEAGNYAAALEHGEEAIRLSLEVGDRLNVAIAQNNVGDALRDLGRHDDAGLAYAAAIEGYRDLGDPGPLMALLEDVAVLVALRAQHADAFRLLGAADTLRETLGSRRSAAAEAALAGRLAPGRDAIDGPAADAPRAEGRRLSLPEAIDLAIAVTRSAANLATPG